MPDLENQDHVRLRALLWQPNSPPTPYTIQESCECADECILDLVHYCQRRITKLVASGEGGGGRKGGGDGGGDDSDSERNYLLGEKLFRQDNFISILCGY